MIIATAKQIFCKALTQALEQGNSVHATFGTPLEGTSYHYYNQNTPQDGYYYIIKSTNDNSGNIWFHNPPISDHSSNGGYFLMVNASYAKDEFYRQRITRPDRTAYL